MRSLVAMVLIAALSAACATEPEPLDRTQPESVNKAMFAGEWHYKLTVTDADAKNPFTFIGEETASYVTGGSKIRWEITENNLLGYLIPQRYRDPSGKLVENEIGQKSLVLSFPIVRHFDIRYAYNPTTREDLNVIVENTDRPWNQREYMVVDWSRNLATYVWNPTQLDQTIGNLEREPIAAYDNVEFFMRGASPESDVRVETRKWNPSKDPEVYAFNIDTRESLLPRLTSSSQLYYGDYGPVNVRFRHSLLKAPAPEQSAYAPLQYPDEFFRRFGFFRTEYEVFDPERRSLDSQKQYLVNRWNFAGGRKLAWYASPALQAQIDAGDTELRDYSREVVAQWNLLMKEALGREDDVMEFRENARLLDAQGNPVTTASGEPRWRFELGDLRFSFINIVQKPQSAPLGYGPSVADSDSGEIVNGTVNIYGEGIDWVVRRAMDLYDVASGNCTLDELKNGLFFDPDTGRCDSLSFHGVSNGGNLRAEVGSSSQALSSEAKSSALPRSLSPTLKTAYWPKASATVKDAEELRRQFESARGGLKQRFDFERQNPVALDLSGLSALSGSSYESQMVPRGNLSSLLPFAGSADDPDVVAELSPATRLDPRRLEAFKRAQTMQLAVRDDPLMFQPSIHAFVDEMVGQDRDVVYRTLRRWVVYTTTLHEMGHTIGLRHNFTASVDERNFPPEYFVERDAYWTRLEALRAQYGRAIDRGDAVAYEAYVKAVDDLPSRKDRFASSSIMDYVGDWQDWMVGPRTWDRAAINFAYGSRIEVWDAQQSAWVFQPYLDGDLRSEKPLDETVPAASGRRVRPYLFCSDEKTFDDAFCSMFDRGVTATEIVRNFISDAEVSYFMTNFRRQRTSFDSALDGYYWNKWLRTYYTYAKPMAQLSLNSIRHPEFWGSLWSGLDAMIDGPEARSMRPGYFPDGGEDLLRASLTYYYYLVYDVLMRPEYGSFELRRDTSGKQYWAASSEPAADALAAYIRPGEGWGWSDRWDVQDDSQIYEEKLQRIGVELDKIIALEILSIPAVLNTPLTYEKANGVSFWNSLWTGNGHQLWQVVHGLVTDNFSHAQNPWCIRCDAACQADPQAHPPELRTHPVDLLEPLVYSGVIQMTLPQQTRCGADELPVEPGMDALFAIYPIFYGIAGASHPWYHNFAGDYFDSQVKGGNHRFDIPPGAEVVEFVNSTGTKTYQAVQTADGMSASFAIARNARNIKNRVELANLCASGADASSYLGTPGTFGRSCPEVLRCYDPRQEPPAWCEQEGWGSMFLYDGFKYTDVDRAEAMLIMMQDMIDLAGHYAWRVPGYLEAP